MVSRLVVGGWVLALAAIAGCYTGASVDLNATPTTSSADPTDPQQATGNVTGDLPCDVATMLSDNCGSCHGSPLSGGAPNQILTHADLAAPSKSNPKLTVAELSVTRMRDTKRPMPTTGALPDATIAILEGWISAGMPKGTCGGGGQGQSSPASTTSVCTSGTTWRQGNEGSAAMHPGLACVDCHNSSEGKTLQVAGTIYPTAHEPDDCNGTGGSKIVITDTSGKTVMTLTANSAGNFSDLDLSTRVTLPSTYYAKVVSADGTKTREMKTPQTNGDCNACHTESGAQSAPGRVMAP